MADTIAVCLNMREGACRAAIIPPSPRTRPLSDTPDPRAVDIPDRRAERIIPQREEVLMRSRQLIIAHRAAFLTRDRHRDINQQRVVIVRQRRQPTGPQPMAIIHLPARLTQRRKRTMLQVSLLIRLARAVEGQGLKSMRRRKAVSIESS